MTPPAGEGPAVFVDRDGVLCENRADYVRSWSEFAFLPGAVEALVSLTLAGARLFIATNQAVVGRGLISRRTLDGIHEKMLDVLTAAGARIEAVLVCPHHPDDGCACRKPKPGMITEAAGRFDVDLERSFLVGDALSDIEAGALAGCRTVLVRTGRGAAALAAAGRARWRHAPDFVADDLIDAAIWILARDAGYPRARGERARAGRAPAGRARAEAQS